MIYQTKYSKPTEIWEQSYLWMIEYAESCYLRWINCDDLTEIEEQIAVDYQERVEAQDGEILDIEIPPEFVVSPEEFDAFVRIANKLHKSGISTVINAMIETTVNPYLRSGCMKGQDNT